jgi:hypothetical protein
VSASIRLAASLPEDWQDNGLEAHTARFITQPRDTTWAVVRLTTKRLTTDLEDGLVVPTVRIETIEPIVDEHAVAELQRIADLARERRVGGKQLPLPDAADRDGADSAVTL